jgi:hypothetical protein
MAAVEVLSAAPPSNPRELLDPNLSVDVQWDFPSQDYFPSPSLDSLGNIDIAFDDFLDVQLLDNQPVNGSFAASESKPEPSRRKNSRKRGVSNDHQELPSKRRQVTTPRNRILPAAQVILRESYENNPYPEDETIRNLSERTNLTEKTIKTWFSNTRARRSPKADNPATSGTQSPATSSQPTAVSPLTESNISSFFFLQKQESATPLARYVAAPLEEDPVALAVLAAHAKSFPWETSCNNPNYKIRHGGSSIASSAETWASVASNVSRASRRGVRRHAKALPTQYILPPKDQERSFYCTFCGAEFSSRYQWSRHEETIHVPRSLWICPFSQHGETHQECPCCFSPSPSPDHLTTHDEKNCLKMPLEDRTFTRLDHLMQHMEQYHMRTHIITLERRKELGKRWLREAEPLPDYSMALKCGFCGYRSNTWKDRVQHVGNHLQQGADLSQWWLRRSDRKSDFGGLRTKYPKTPADNYSFSPPSGEWREVILLYETICDTYKSIY